MIAPEQVHSVLQVILVVEIIVLIVMWWKSFKWAYYIIMSRLDEHYLCGHSLCRMLDRSFFFRFGAYNEDGFCHMVAATLMLALKDFKRARIVRGWVVDQKQKYESYHSWVEVKVFGHWWVLDPVYFAPGIILRRVYSHKIRPKVLQVDKYATFWSDPYAEKFYEHLQKPELSRIFVNLHYYYTPNNGSLVVPAPEHSKALDWLENQTAYYLFTPDHNFKFSQEIVNDFMARPTRKSPRRRNLRRLASDYRHMDRARELRKKTIPA